MIKSLFDFCKTKGLENQQEPMETEEVTLHFGFLTIFTKWDLRIWGKELTNF
jgi:hypothetical protein